MLGTNGGIATSPQPRHPTPSMWEETKRLYADARAFALALPILFSIPVLIEFAQHVVEIDLGLYRHGLGALAAMDPRRLTLGFTKTLALLLPGYWFVRYIAKNRDAAYAKAIQRPAATLFGIQFALKALAQWWALFGPPLAILLNIPGKAGDYLSLTTMIATSVIGIYLTAWFVAWPLGNAKIGPLKSIALMAGSFWRTIAYTLIGTAPLMALHYALGYGAIGQPEALVWAMMTIDALVVGVLALTMNGAGYLAARHAAQRNNVPLIRAP